MNELLEKWLASFKGTSGGTRVIAVLVGLALVALAGGAALVSNRPHFELAFSGLSDHELAEVCKALADAGIPFEQSQPPGPFVVYVDESQRSAAYMAAYGAGALDKPLEGILSDGSMASVFNSAEERAQGVRKREWQEMEKMLEELDFVSGARVRTSAASGSPLTDREGPAPTASVTLRIAGAKELTPAQAATVANLVSRGLGIEKQHLVISDQSGRSLYDGEANGAEQRGAQDMLAHQGEHDRRLAEEANEVLTAILGPNKARVSVSSEWDYSQTTLRNETPGKSTVLQETKTSSEKPVSGSGGTTAGLSANTLDPDQPDALPPGTTPAAPLLEKTTEEKKSYSPTISREERVRLVPELKRLSVALFLDQSVPDPQALEDALKAAVGFDAERGDEFKSVVLTFAAPTETPAEGAAAESVPQEPNPLLETLLRRGVEIVSAVVFIVVLLKTVKGSKKEKAAAAAAATTVGATQVDAELLARAQVEELLKSEPGKVGEILARWAREEPVAGAR